MKFLSVLVVCLPAVSANYPWWTNRGWAKPADFNSKECAGNPNAQYFCSARAVYLEQGVSIQSQMHSLGGAILALWRTLWGGDVTGRVL
ncbi:hypothetical protein NW769_014998 [Fusarium oxysporum]|nr:hypothetical protein NW769_014998 [Fusarium oxysporum]